MGCDIFKRSSLPDVNRAVNSTRKLVDMQKINIFHAIINNSACIYTPSHVIPVKYLINLNWSILMMLDLPLLIPPEYY
jgi:hypothetical protein